MDLRDELRTRRIEFEPIWHRPEASSSRRAGSVHVPGHRVAKSVLVRSDDRYFLAVLPATTRIDWGKLAAIVPGTGLRLATEDEIATIFDDCERGALPPFGPLYGLPTVVDASLAAGHEIVVEGNLRHLDLRLRYDDFARLVAPIRGRFAEPLAPPRRRVTSGRRAN